MKDQLEIFKVVKLMFRTFLACHGLGLWTAFAFNLVVYGIFSLFFFIFYFL